MHLADAALRALPPAAESQRAERPPHPSLLGATADPSRASSRPVSNTNWFVLVIQFGRARGTATPLIDVFSRCIRGIRSDRK